ncbi:hypothetical protein [Nitrosomonas communis]|uniref:hypothetical protein n=1 Tax=Nitrosomonas communis TaxID=44574 RepID=UPI0026ED230D|nr:hypothetical protein [Nitrosomonas communis]MCO6427990.1 hypothetical protein [Nitrosomonas communis]
MTHRDVSEIFLFTQMVRLLGRVSHAAAGMNAALLQVTGSTLQRGCALPRTLCSNDGFFYKL